MTGQEALKTIKIKCHPNSNPSPLVDNALDIVEKSIKALEIIKKNFEFGLFETDKYKVYIYSSDDDYSVVKRISEEEFNILKEVLE